MDCVEMRKKAYPKKIPLNFTNKFYKNGNFAEYCTITSIATAMTPQNKAIRNKMIWEKM